MEITKAEIRRWQTNSLVLAQSMGYDSEILFQMQREQKKVLIGLDSEIQGKAGVWFGYCAYNAAIDDRRVLLIGVSPRNLSTETEQIVEAELRSLGVPDPTLSKVMRGYRSVSREDFFEIYNQSGMDHELIGHAYHHLRGEPHGEEVAVKEQLTMAAVRAKRAPEWKII